MAKPSFSIPLSDNTYQQLEQLSVDTERSKSEILEEAVSLYAYRENVLHERTLRGLADVRAGLYISQEESKARIAKIRERLIMNQDETRR